MLVPRGFISVIVTLFLASVLAEVPAELSQGFDTEMQVSYNGDSSIGFQDGDKVPFTDTSEVPVFALGDSSGVNTRVSFMIMMIDTTDQSNFVMHYLETDYKASGEKTGLTPSGSAQVPYAKPGSLGESGARQYTFLLYLQDPDTKITSTPIAGDKFDANAFNTANSLEPANAGLSMKVEIGDTSDAASVPASDSFSSEGDTSNASSDQKSTMSTVTPLRLVAKLRYPPTPAATICPRWRMERPRMRRSFPSPEGSSASCLSPRPTAATPHPNPTEDDL